MSTETETPTVTGDGTELKKETSTIETTTPKETELNGNEKADEVKENGDEVPSNGAGDAGKQDNGNGTESHLEGNGVEAKEEEKSVESAESTLEDNKAATKRQAVDATEESEDGAKKVKTEEGNGEMEKNGVEVKAAE